MYKEKYPINEKFFHKLINKFHNRVLRCCPIVEEENKARPLKDK